MKKSKSSKLKSENGTANELKPDDFLIVGIGASAGGIQALKQFFGNVSADSGAAYVVILHLSPEHESRLAEVLQTNSKISVTQVTERVKVEPNHVFVVPPNRSLAMSDGHIVVSPIKTIEERRAPVDIFFRTLAETHHEQAVCVVLSGTGADGSMGLKRVKENGGAVFVQNPREAEYNDMVRNAIATDLVDEVLNVAEIPAKIVEYRENLKAVALPVQPEAQPDEQQKALRDVFTQLRVHTGHDFTNYKRPTILRRIERRISVRSLPGIAEYAAYLKKQPEEVQALLKDLLISVTNFFRDKQAFAVLEHDVIPRVTHEKRADDQIRVWVAGCATGEEAYSIAMLLAERLDGGGIDAPEIQIFASDIDETAIGTAREGLYTLNDAADVSPERLRRFFTKEGDGYRVRRELREMVLFANHNVLKDPPFSRLDLVTCRNMLIYLNPAAQKRVMETFHFALKPNGFLFLGASESIDGSIDVFAPVSKENNIFQSRSVEARIPRPVRNLLQNETFAERLEYLQTSALRRVVAPTTTEQDSTKQIHSHERLSYADLHQQLLEQFAPPSVVVNEEYDILHLSERAGRFMQIQGGEPSNNLLKTIRPELRLELRNALYQAAQKRRNVEAKNLTLKIDDRSETINIHVRPVLRAEDTARGFILVLFDKTEDAPAGDAETVIEVYAPAAQQLEAELIRIKAQLRSSSEQYEVQTEELRASNEELQALNEELRSSSEELETGKEELQSLNEELQTVNQELKIKIEEISLTSNNLQNLVNSTDIGTIFLDRNFRVQLFTPSAREIFNLIPTDFNRPLSDITHRLEGNGLLHDAETVLEKLQTVEREVRTVDNRVFTMRVLPYRTADDRIQGTVITFFDITERKRADEARFYLASIVESSVDSMLTVDLSGTITSWNRAAEQLYGYPASEAIGKPLTLLTLPGDLAEVLRNADKIKHSRQVEIYDTVRVNKDRREMNLEVVLSPVKDSSGAVIGVSTIARDVTERRLATERLRVSEERLRLLIESAKDYAIFMLDNDRRVSSWNTGGQTLFGYAEGEILGEPGDIVFTPEDRKRGEPQREEKNAREKGQAINERWHIRKDGSRFWGSGLVNPLLDERGNQIGSVKIMRDLTEQRQAEEIAAANLQDTQILQELSARLISEENVQMIYDEIMTAAIRLIRADAGTVQIYDADSKELVLLAANGFKRKMTRYFERVNADSKTACGVALRNGERTFADFAEADADESLRMHAEAGYHAAQSTPLVGRSGKPIGMLNTHWKEAKHRPTERELRFLDLLARQAADLIEQRRAEEKLRESEERFRAMFEQANVGIVQITVDGRLLMPNQGFCKIIGYTEKECAKLNVRDVTHAEDYKKELKLTRQLTKGEISGYSLEKRYVRKDGKIVWGNMTATVVRSPAHDPLYVVAIVEDISERKQAEESIGFQAKLLDSVEQAVIATDTDGKIVFWNEFAEKLYGWTAEEVKGRNIREITTPEMMVEQAAEIMSLLNQGKSWSGEFEVKRRDGTTFPAQVFNSPINDGQGKLIGIVGVSIDITERRQTEEKLRESAEFNGTVISSLTAQVAVLDSDGKISIVNEAWRRFARENGGEDAVKRTGIGVNYLQVCRRAKDDCADKTLAGIEAVLQGKLPTFSLEYPCDTREKQRWFLLNVSPLQGGRGGAVVSHLDITERKQAEEGLSKSEERLRLLIESASDYAIFTVTKDNLVDSWNTGAEHTFGWKEKEIIGKSGAILFTPEDQARGVHKMEIECAAETGKAEDERWHIRKDGSCFYASGVMQPLRNGGIHGFVKICRDQTDKIEAEKAVQDKEILQRLVGAQEDERKRIARDLHDELGQQLTALRMKLEATRKICEEEEICGKIDEIQVIAKQIDADVDFLAWELRPAALDDLGLIAALENYVREWSHHAGVTAELHASKLKKMRLAPEIETNLYRITQEALNNTHKHARAKSASVVLEKRDDLIVLIVEDDGIGFKPKDKKNRSKGLGLMGIEERAALVGGTSEIESAPKQGTTIFVRVPASFSGKNKKEKENV